MSAISKINRFELTSKDEKATSPSQNNFNLLSDDLLRRIFLKLSSEDLAKTPLVCRRWNFIVNENYFWKLKILSTYKTYSASILNIFSTPSLQNKIDLKLHYFLSPLYIFYLKTEETFMQTSLFSLLDENKALKSFELPTLFLPKYFATNGIYTFIISNLVNVKIIKRNEKVLILKGVDIPLTHLQIDGNYLFILRADGKIIQYNYKTNKIIKKIDTAFSKKDERVRPFFKNHLENWAIAMSDTFFVQNGNIYIKYGFNRCSFFEVIPYSNVSQSKLIKDDEILSASRILEFGNLIYFLADRKIIIFDQKTLKKIKTIRVELDPLDKHLEIVNLLIHKDFLYVIDSRGALHVIDKNSLKEIKKITLNSIHIKNALVFQDKLFLSGPKDNFFYSSFYKIMVLDLNSLEVLEDFQDIFDESDEKTLRELIDQIFKK